MALELASLVVPGLGPVAEVLQLICTAAGEMQESSELCARVHEQLVFLHDKLRAMERKHTLPSAALVAKYTRLVGDFSAFLDKHRRKVWIYRVVKYKRMLAYVDSVQQDIATLMLALSVCHIEASADERAEMAQFRAQQRRFLEQQQRAIAARLTDDAVVAKEVAHEAQQVEALSVFRYELQAAQHGRTDLPEVVEADPSEAADCETVNADLNAAVLRTALDKIMRRSSVRVAHVPAWFLPPHRVEFEPQAFARGSFSTVHYGTMGFTDVVVKCLLTDTHSNGAESAASRCRREADLWSALRHSHVLAMYGACDMASPPFIVCERARHGTLFALLASAHHHSAHAMAFRLLRDATAGLAYLHAQRVVHGDLKCDNILVMGDGTAKIADFSTSYVRTSSGGGDDSAAGALRWCAPECLADTYRRPTFASDVFALGMCVLEALSQQLPWGYDLDDDAVRRLVQSGELPEQPTNVTDRAWALVQRMCSFEPGDRPSLELVIAELDELAADQAAVLPLMCEDAPSFGKGTTPSKDATDVVDNQRDCDDPAPTASRDNEPRGSTQPSSPSSSSTNTAESRSNQQPESPRSSTPVMTLEHVTQLLLARCASAQIPVLLIAAEAGETECVRVLLCHDTTDVQTKCDADGSTALHLAAANGHGAVVSELLRSGAKADAQDLFAKRPLHVAALQDRLECVALLLEHGAEPNARDDDRQTPLGYAVRRGRIDIARVLLDAGAKVAQKDVEMAKALDHRDIVELLELRAPSVLERLLW